MGNEGLEQFGFVCSFLIFPLGAIYELWSIAPKGAGDSWNLTSASGAQISTTAFCLFVAIPLLYGMINRTTSPRIDSIHNLVDDHTRQQAPVGDGNLVLEKEQ